MNLFSFIKSNIPIVSVISDHVTLKRAGVYLKGSCPFHSEKTASFTVSPHKEIFYCFGCHTGGDVITFISKLENCTPLEAAHQLCDRYHLSIPDQLTKKFNSTFSDGAQKKGYEQLCTEVASWCHEQLLKSPMGLRYLEKRGMSSAIIKQFQIGYFPAGQQGVKAFCSALQKKSFLVEDALRVNFLRNGKNSSSLYSPFEDRIIFPIKDHLGRSCGFGGRTFKPHDERAKYYNSHENEFFIKGSLLYGLDLAKREIQQRGSAILVEGYTDCISLAQHGYSNSVATLGTACSAEHLKLLSRYTQQLFIMYDGDQAGQKAIIRLTELCWNASLELKIITLPSSDDPASFCARGGCVKDFIDRAADIFTFFITMMGKGLGVKTLGEKLTVAQKILELITHVHEPIKRELLINQAAATLDIPTDALKKHLLTISEPKINSHTPSAELSQNTDDPLGMTSPLEQSLCAAVLTNFKFYQSISLIVDHLGNPLRTIMYQVDEFQKKESPDDNFSAFFETLTQKQQAIVSHLLVKIDSKFTPELFESLIIQFHKKHWKTIARDVKEKIKRAQQQRDMLLMQQLLADFTKLQQHIRKRSDLWHT